MALFIKAPAPSTTRQLGELTSRQELMMFSGELGQLLNHY